METMTVTLNPENSAFVKRILSEGKYANAGDFLAELVADARKKRWQAHIERLLEEGLASESIEVTDEMWDELLRKHDVEYPSSALS